MTMRRGWKAEEWRGKINRVRFVKAALTLDEKEAGLSVFEVYGEPVTSCGVCGTPLYHYWKFERADGGFLDVGQECAAVVLGQSPASYLNDEADRRSAEEALLREESAKATARRWWRAPEQAVLRRAVVTGLRAERTLRSSSEFYARAWKISRAGAVSPKFRAWVETASGTDARAAAERTATALQQLSDLSLKVRASKFDAPIIQDMADRAFPIYDDRKIWGAVLSEKQAALISKLHKRYGKQLMAESNERKGN